MAYDSPDARIEQFLKEWVKTLWGWAKLAIRFAIEVFKQGSWAFKEAIPPERRRRRFY